MLLFVADACPQCRSHAVDRHVIRMAADTGTIVYGQFCVVIPCKLWDRKHCSSPLSVCVCLLSFHRRCSLLAIAQTRVPVHMGGWRRGFLVVHLWRAAGLHTAVEYRVLGSFGVVWVAQGAVLRTMCSTVEHIHTGMLNANAIANTPGGTNLPSVEGPVPSLSYRSPVCASLAVGVRGLRTDPESAHCGAFFSAASCTILLAS